MLVFEFTAQHFWLVELCCKDLLVDAVDADAGRGCLATPPKKVPRVVGVTDRAEDLHHIPGINRINFASSWSADVLNTRKTKTSTSLSTGTQSQKKALLLKIAKMKQCSGRTRDRTGATGIAEIDFRIQGHNH